MGNKITGYEKDYHSHFHKHLLTNEKYYLFRARYAKKKYWKFLKSKNTGQFLELGIGLGQNMFCYKNQSQGVDISDFSIKKCAERGIKVHKDIAKLPSHSFDGLLSVHCLEHLENPARYLKHMNRVLKYGGRLVLVLPHERSKPKKFKPSVDQHLYNWTFQSIGNLLHKTGFEIVKNKFNYAHGFSLFYKLPDFISYPLLSGLGWFRDCKEMVIVAEKK